MNEPTHINIDICRVEPNRLGDTQFIENYINQTCRIHNLKPIGIPNIYKFGGEGGVTASQILGASLLSIHTYPEHGSIYIDIFSCETFDILAAFEHAKQTFNSQYAYFQKITRMKLKETLDYDERSKP